MPNSYFPTSNLSTAPPPMPPPPLHHNQHHRQETHEDGDDGSDDDSERGAGNTFDLGDSFTANPGITGHDPSKLNTHLDDYNTRKRPSIYRFIARFIQLIANIGTFVFILCAPIYSKQGKPDFIPQNLVVGIYIVSIVSILVSLGYLIFYGVRRFRTKTKKLSRWILLLVDGIFGASYGLLMVFSIKDTRCGIGQENGW
ncbi:19013_t:CDS:2 [Entrophospora sp. SA101]|nr:19013_t:CDS:2 [Entrophospora sp. SA101]CAJ0843816.1 5866_t:CDS:2 [Entrophospora sp. SA101]